MRSRPGPAGVLILLGVLLPAAPAVAITHGFYYGLALGGGSVWGDRGVPIEGSHACDASLFLVEEQGYCVRAPTQALFEEASRTDFGTGLFVDLRLGYNIASLVSPEASFSSNFSPSFNEVLLHAGGQIRYHPLGHFSPLESRRWDVSVFAGFGHTKGGYYFDDETQQGFEEVRPSQNGFVWKGLHFSLGVGVDHQVDELQTAGAEIKLMVPRLATFQNKFTPFDPEPERESTPQEVPSTVALMLNVVWTAHPFP